MGERSVVCMFLREDVLGADDAVSQVLARLDAAGCAVHLFCGETCRELTPTHATGTLYQSLQGRLESGAAFITDMPSFMALAYRLFHDTFDAFALAPPAAGESRDYETARLPYAALLRAPTSGREGLVKPIYLIGESEDSAAFASISSSNSSSSLISSSNSSSNSSSSSRSSAFEARVASLPESVRSVAASFLPFDGRAEDFIAAPGGVADYIARPVKVFVYGGEGYVFEPALGETRFIRVGSAEAEVRAKDVSKLQLCFPKRKHSSLSDIIAILSHNFDFHGYFEHIRSRLNRNISVLRSELELSSRIERSRPS